MQLVWTDPSGTAHPFNGGYTVIFDPCTNGITQTNPTFGGASDGSGYNSADDGSGNAIITDNSGTEVYPQIIDRYGNYFAKDSNGNLQDDTGRVPVIVTQNANGNANVTWYDVLAPNGPINNNGTRVRYIVTTVSIPVATNFRSFGDSDIYPWNPSTPYLTPVQSILLPDGSQYTFGYDNTGELSTVTLPTGGIITYGYGNFVDSANTENRWLTSRTVGSNPAMNFTPSVVASCSNYAAGCVEQVKLHKPSADETVYQLTLINGAWNTGVTTYTGSAASGQKLSQTTSTNTYTNGCMNFYPCLGGNYVSQTLATTALFATPSTSAVYTQTQSVVNASIGKIQDVKEWDYVPSSPSTTTAPTRTPTRETQYSYTGNDLEHVKVLDANGNQAGLTTYGYTLAAATTSNITQHGTSHAGGPYLNTVSHWLNTGGSAVTTYAMYDTGQVQSVADANNNPATTFTYQCSGSLPLTVVDSLGHSTQYGYDCSSGAPTSVQDANDLAAQPQRAGTTYSYDGTAGRLYTVTQPDGGTTTYTYPSSTEVDTAMLATPNPTITSSSVVDAYGRSYQQVTGTSVTDTTYDANGRSYCTSAPHTSGVATTGSACITSYDGLDRPLTQKQADGNSFRNWTYNANVVGTTDEANNTWTRTADAFGRITSVVEPGGSQTSYTYDGLGNAIYINQQGVGSETARTRTFIYDSMSRLITSQTPEAATVCYGTWNNRACVGGYDLNSNLLAKTDARGLTTSYYYDSLNRLTYKGYSDGVTPGERFVYDIAPGWMPDLQNVIGRLANSANDYGGGSSTTGKATAAAYSYDPLGRVVRKWQQVPSASPGGYFVSAAYDLAGNMSSLTYPDGRSVVQNFDNAGRLGSVTSGTTASPGPAYLSSIAYNPDGSPNVETFGNNVQRTTAENSRLQVQSMVVASASGGNPFSSHTYCYSGCTTGGPANNGNIWGIVDNLNTAKTQGFTYDSLRRITGFTLNGATRQQYTTDSFGNISRLSGSTALTTFDPTTNRINSLPCATSTMPFDNAGNQLCDTDTYGGVRQYQYDAESRIKQITSLGSSTPFETYIYDGNGARVRKTNADGTFTEYVDFDGHVIAEKNQMGAWSDYIYANGQMIARTGGQKMLQLTGTAQNTSSATWFNLSWSADGRAIGVGDRLAIRERTKSGTYGGVAIGFTDNSQTSWTSAASDNYGYANQGTTNGQWVSRVFNLDAFAGRMPVAICLGQEGGSQQPGSFEVDFADVALVKADGTVVTLFDGQSNPFSASPTWSSTSSVTAWQIAPTTDQTAVAFFVGDHLGSSQMVLSSGGWPTWQGSYAPFGQEIVAGALSSAPGYQEDGSPSHYKFTGLERDNESGLDHAMARQYSFITGRWVSPDPYDGSMDFGNPQSLNRYAYVGNNPMIYTDPSGLFTCGICTSLSAISWQQLVAGGLVGGALFGIEEGIESIVGLFAHPTFHGSTSSRPGGHIWDEHGSYQAKPYSSAAEILNLGTSGCEFGACGGSFGPGSWSSGAYPNGNDPTDLNLLGGLLDTLNPMRFKRVQCAQQALKKNGVALALDVAGVGAGFLPGGELVVAGAQAGISVASGINSAVTGDAAGAVGSVLGLPAAYAGYGARFLGVGAKAIPGIGSAISALGAFNDGYGTYRDYQTCRARR